MGGRSPTTGERALSGLWGRLARDSWQRLRGRAVLLVVLLVANSLLEGIGIALLLPLLRALGIGGAPGASSGLVGTLDRATAAVTAGGGWPALVALIAAAFLVQNAIFLAQSWLAADLQHRYAAQWRDDLFRAVMHSRWRFVVGRKGGELANTIIGETNRLSGAFYLSVQLVAAAVFMLVYGGLALAVSWQVTVALLLVGLTLVVLVRSLVQRGHRIGVALSRGNEDLQTVTGEFLGGMKLIKGSATEDAAAARFSGVVDALRREYFRSSFHPSVVRSLFEFCGITALVTTLAVGTRVLGVDPARIVVVVALFVRFYPRLAALQQGGQALSVYLPAILTTTETLEAARAEAETLTEEPLPAAMRNRPLGLRAEGLTVRYGATVALQDVDVSVPAGTTVAFVGSSGAGKSTFADAVLRLVEPAAGRLLVEGTPLDALPLTAWRRNVGYVAQDSVFFHASVRDNLCWGRPEATQGEVIEAARRAFAHEFILALPHGYDTMVGDRGVRLSGGQRQRLGLARALLGRPAVLILDEATSALDSASEDEVLRAIAALRGRSTIVVVAHRLSTVRGVDKIYVLEEGRVVEEGSWDDLLSRRQRFYHLWSLQNHGS